MKIDTQIPVNIFLRKPSHRKYFDKEIYSLALSLSNIQSQCVQNFALIHIRFNFYLRCWMTRLGVVHSRRQVMALALSTY